MNISEYTIDIRAENPIPEINKLIDKMGFAVLKDVFIFLEEESQAGILDTSMLHNFTDQMAKKYESATVQQAEWLGYDPNVNLNFT